MKQKRQLPFIPFLAIAAAVPVVLLAFLVPARGQEAKSPVQQQPPPATGIVPPTSEAAASPRSASPLRGAFDAVRGGRHKEAARLLKAIDVNTLEPDDARRWRTLAAQTAVRIGDAKWLKAINDDPNHFSNSLDLLILTAQRFLQAGDYAQTRSLLQRVPHPEGLDEIPRRRYLELYARLEQLEGHPAAERVYIAKLIDFTGRWASPTCQACHANPRQYGESVTTLDIANWWGSDRFVELLKSSGDARAVRDSAALRLRNRPDDTAARLRLALALRAEGDTEAAEKTLRALPWTAFPDRENKTPLRLATFP